MTDKAQVKLNPDLRDRLRARKIGGETYSDVVGRLLSEVDDPR